MIFYLLLFFVIGVYGFIHYRLAARNLVELGYINGRGIIVSQSEARQVWKSKSRAVYEQQVRFTYNGSEETAVFIRERGPRDEDIGKEIDIMICTTDISKSLPGRLEGETRMGIVLMIIGAAGCIIFAVLVYWKYMYP